MIIFKTLEYIYNAFTIGWRKLKDKIKAIFSINYKAFASNQIAFVIKIGANQLDFGKQHSERIKQLQQQMDACYAKVLKKIDDKWHKKPLRTRLQQRADPRETALMCEKTYYFDAGSESCDEDDTSYQELPSSYTYRSTMRRKECSKFSLFEGDNMQKNKE